jgi:hypothetical protein
MRVEKIAAANTTTGDVYAQVHDERVAEHGQDDNFRFDVVHLFQANDLQ